MADTIVFRTERLSICRIVASDAEYMFSVYGDPVAARWVDDVLPITRSECLRWIEVTINNYAARGYGMFAVVKSEVVIGFCGIVHPGGQKEPEIKYSFLRGYWGNGYATEAVRGLIKYGKNTHGIRYYVATVAPENIASQRVLMKVDMRRGELRLNKDGTCTQVFEWGIRP